ncbi:MAG: DUF6665 family protein [Pseudomonadota bacterium]
MAVKPPTFDGLRNRNQTALNILDGEIMAEVASAIGRCGRAFEKALANLKDHDRNHPNAKDGPKRLALVQEAADRAWALFIQYELAGLSTQHQLVKRYNIPGEVLVRVGIRQKETQISKSKSG